MWDKVCNGKIPLSPDGETFDTHEQFETKGWCCYNAAVDVLKLVFQGQDIPISKRKKDWVPYDEFCIKHGREL